LDLLFRKDVCAVHDLPSRADFHRREHRQRTVGDNADGQPTTSSNTSPGKLMRSKKESVGEYPAPASGLHELVS